MEKKGMSRIKDNKIFVVQFNENQIKFNLLLNQKKNKIQPIEIPLLRIEKIVKITKKEKENYKEIIKKKLVIIIFVVITILHLFRIIPMMKM